MDVNTMYAASSLGLQDEYDTQIIKDVWNNDVDMSNMNAGEATKACRAVYESQGVKAEEKCYNAALSCGSDANCNALAVKYAQALAGGYSKDFESFKKKSNILSQAGEIAGGILSGLLGGLGGKDRIDVEDDTYIPPPPTPIGLYIAVGVLAVVGIGLTIYFVRKKK